MAFWACFLCTRRVQPVVLPVPQLHRRDRHGSRAHCAAWERARAMLAAAEQRDQLQGELTAINAQLRVAPLVEAADPQADAIVHALGFAGIKIADPRDVGYALVLLLAAIAELMAAFGGLMCGVRLPGHQVTAVTGKAGTRAAATAPAVERPTDAPCRGDAGRSTGGVHRGVGEMRPLDPV